MVKAVPICPGHGEEAFPLSDTVKDICKIVMEKCSNDESTVWFNANYPDEDSENFAALIKVLHDAIENNRIVMIMHHIRKDKLN